MSGTILFQHRHRGNVWRLEVSAYNGHEFVNLRKWFQQGDNLRPTKEGVTFPLERLPELHEAIGVYLDGNHY
ncbi:transcriptional coactivator p15/PC4 family protein [Sphingomonas sp. NSE70-1]|uniref:Transcriptional coactivator p15/PC4 family protein n=1 Tax=Sphingomonas caseinilyticus TaxID=2908205 RepID=A0ABT0RTM0_9SPHN|nr:transcriptional coactivator p15/PC4 family protein [Sphingomonas caseinilyticus]MCL6698291.1 transcriptional coactivator p15/PC4 family protein [Sphingomonas caseinilyticus]